MNFRWFHCVLVVLAVLIAQGAGLHHGIAHHEHLQSAAVQAPSQQAGHLHAQHTHSHDAAELLHNCLLVDGITTASAATARPFTGQPAPLVVAIRTRLPSLQAPQNTLFAQRVRVRDPPVLS